MPSMSNKTSPIGIRELAKTLNLSIGTVSRSLNNRYGVNAQTRAKVLEAAQRMGYVPNRAARALKDRPAFQIGLLFNPFYGRHHEVNPYATTLIDAVRQAGEHDGIAVEVLDFAGDEAIESQFDRASTDVALLLGHFPESTYEKVHALGKPSINLEYHSGLPRQVSILSDGRAACGTAVQYLAALGHRRIGLVNGPMRASRFAHYFEGFSAALREFCLPRDEGWVVELDPDAANAEGARSATGRILDCHESARPTAIIFASDWLAIGGIDAIRAKGLRVPEDISVIGYDNLPQAETTDPPLTTFDMHMPMVARAIIRLTLELGAGRSPRGLDNNDTLYLHANLVKRQSCACLRSAPSERRVPPEHEA